MSIKKQQANEKFNAFYSDGVDLPEAKVHFAQPSEDKYSADWRKEQLNTFKKDAHNENAQKAILKRKIIEHTNIITNSLTKGASAIASGDLEQQTKELGKLHTYYLILENLLSEFIRILKHYNGEAEEKKKKQSPVKEVITSFSEEVANIKAVMKKTLTEIQDQMFIEERRKKNIDCKMDKSVLKVETCLRSTLKKMLGD